MISNPNSPNPNCPNGCPSLVWDHLLNPGQNQNEYVDELEKITESGQN